jgi:formylglycine-generating enzyme required for sulfatase activity
MITAEAKMTLSRTPLPFLVTGLLAAIIAGAALLQRGPDPALLPDMADHRIIFPNGHAFYAQKYEVTVSEWNMCFEQGACSLELRTRSNEDPARTPATGLSYVDVREYVDWISDKTGNDFRLPTVEEWNFMAAQVLPEKQNPLFTDPSLTWASAYLTQGIAPRALKPQGSFSTSPEGVTDLDGSVWEWTQECYAGVAEGIDPTRCPAYFVGGEHVAAMSYLVRDPARGGCAVGQPPAHLGMRLVSDSPV